MSSASCWDVCVVELVVLESNSLSVVEVEVRP